MPDPPIEHIPEAAVEALARASNCPVIGNCANCKCRKGLAAALPHLVTEDAVTRADAVLHTGHGMHPMARMAVRDEIRSALRAALGTQDEQEAGTAVCTCAPGACTGFVGPQECRRDAAREARDA